MSKSELKKIVGITDEPTDEDKLNRINYVKALADFIKTTETPMTISITGEWGIGKTSFVHQVKTMLEGNVGTTESSFTKIRFIEFHTWEISQFEQNDQLKISLLQNFVSETLKDDPEILKKMKVIMDRFVKLAASLTVKTILNIEKDFDSDNNEQNSLVDEVKKLKTELQNYFNKSNTKYVIFIDDLDRIDPINAVEILEFLKLFLSMKNCVYLVAIDDKVIEQGLENKYGEMSTFYKDKRNYFEKLIQLPFYLPNSLLDDQQLGSYLESLNLEELLSIDKENLELACKLIKLSVGANPRRIKRIINSCLLLKFIVKNEANSILLFYIVCFQNFYNKEYEEFKLFMINNKENKSSIEDYIENIEADSNENFIEFIKLLKISNLEFSSDKFCRISIASGVIDDRDSNEETISLTSRLRNHIPIIFKNSKKERLSRSFIHKELLEQFPELEDSPGTFNGLMNRVNLRVGVPIVDDHGYQLVKDAKKNGQVCYRFEQVKK